MKAFNRVACGLMILGLVSTRAHGGEPAPRHDGSEIASRIDDYLARMESFGFHGSILVGRGDRVILSAGYGIADHSTGAPITADTVFHLGSLGKQFTASAILLLQEQGELSVHDTIGEHLPKAPADKRDITIHQLLTHTAGFPYQPGLGPTLDLPLQAAPGEQWSYSNPGYAVLYDIVEAVSGESFCGFMNSRFFMPLGMTRTGCAESRFDDMDDLARAYTDDTDQGTVISLDWSRSYRGAGDIASTVNDLWAWEQALRNHSILSENTTESLFSTHAESPGGGIEYGYGWMILTTERGSRIARHPGNYGGFNCDYRRYIDEDLTIIFLSNHFVQGRSMREAVLNDVSRLVNGGETKDPPRVIDLDAERLKEIEGVYEFNDGIRLTVTAAHGGLAFGAATAEGYELLYEPGLPTAPRAEHHQWREATIRFIDAAATHGDTEPLRSVISPALPYEGAAADLLELFENLSESLGDYRATRHAGTVTADRGRSARIFVKVEFERGEAIIETTWRGGVLHIDRATALPARQFLPTGEETFIAYDIFSGDRMLAQFSVDGGVRYLHLLSGGVDIVGRLDG